MARSKDALERRAAKRGRSVDEERMVEVTKKAARQSQPEKKRHPPQHDLTATTTNDSAYERALNEPGAWQCPSCGNHNFASRDTCRSTTCRAERIATIAEGGDWSGNRPRHPPAPARRHDLTTSKTLSWPVAAATRERLSENQRLRRLYYSLQTTTTATTTTPTITMATDSRERSGSISSSGRSPSLLLTAEEMERAEILIQRDERKKQKKAIKKKLTAGATRNVEEEEKQEQLPQTSDDGEKKNRQRSVDELSSSSVDSPITTLPDNKLQNKLNKALRKKFAKTGANGMSDQEIARYHLLVARQERKRQQREERRKAAVVGGGGGGGSAAKNNVKQVLVDNTGARNEPATDSDGTAVDKQIIAEAAEEPLDLRMSKEQTKAIRKQYKETGGAGISKMINIEQAKTSIEKRKVKNDAKHLASG